MGKMLSINKEIYSKDIYKQEPQLCVPTVLSIIIDNEFGYELPPINCLKTLIYDENINFNVSNEKTKKYFIEKYNMDFPINEQKNGLIINRSNLNNFFKLIDFIINVNNYPVYTKTFLKEIYIHSSEGQIYNTKNFEKYNNIKDVIKFFENKIDKSFYIIAFINYSILEEKEINYNSNHCVIVNKIIDENNLELLIPHENDYVESRIVSIELFEKSLIPEKNIYGYSLIHLNWKG